jgi:hypothetical protein
METAVTALKVACDLRKEGFTGVCIANAETWEECDEDGLALAAAGEHESQAAHATPDPAASPAPDQMRPGATPGT